MINLSISQHFIRLLDSESSFCYNYQYVVRIYYLFVLVYFYQRMFVFVRVNQKTKVQLSTWVSTLSYQYFQYLNNSLNVLQVLKTSAEAMIFIDILIYINIYCIACWNKYICNLKVFLFFVYNNYSWPSRSQVFQEFLKISISKSETMIWNQNERNNGS